MTAGNRQESASRERGDDTALARAAAAGDRRAQTLVAERMYERVRATVLYLCGDHRDRDDFVQVSLAEILRSIGGFRGESSLETWANRIAVRKTLRLLKQRQRRDRVVALAPEARPAAASEALGGDQRYFVRRQLAAIVAALPFKYRTVLVLRLVHGFTPDEIADIVEAPLNTVRQRLRRGRRRLAEAAAKDPVFADWVRSRER